MRPFETVQVAVQETRNVSVGSKIRTISQSEILHHLVFHSVHFLDQMSEREGRRFRAVGNFDAFKNPFIYERGVMKKLRNVTRRFHQLVEGQESIL